jgi:hypothetical protein
VARVACKQTPAIFYSFPVARIVEWCGVGISTAYAFKNGHRKPPGPVVKLMRLYGNRKVLGASWPRWRVLDDAIVDPEGNVTTRTQLLAYAVMLQYLAELTRDDPVKHAEFRRLLNLAA